MVISSLKGNLNLALAFGPFDIENHCALAGVVGQRYPGSLQLGTKSELDFNVGRKLGTRPSL